MKKCILDMRVVENLRLHKNYCLLKLTPDGQTILSIIGDDELAKRFS